MLCAGRKTGAGRSIVVRRTACGSGIRCNASSTTEACQTICMHEPGGQMLARLAHLPMMQQ
jgi:hypothetical protein